MKYLYKGPLSGVTLKTSSGNKEITLVPNTHVELPADNDYVKTLVALGHLTVAVEVKLASLPKAVASTSNKLGDKNGS